MYSNWTAVSAWPHSVPEEDLARLSRGDTGDGSGRLSIPRFALYYAEGVSARFVWWTMSGGGWYVDVSSGDVEPHKTDPFDGGSGAF